MSDQNSLDLMSKDELEKQQPERIPLEAEDYIVKIAKIDLVKSPTFNNRVPNYNVLELNYRLICLPSGLKAGGQMKFVGGKEANALRTFIFRNVSFKTGFMPDQVTPSLLRALIAYMQGVDPNERISAPGFVVLDPKQNEVTDEEVKKKVMAERQDPEGESPLTAEGYKVIPDIRSFEGKYIACAVEADTKKGRNKITKFSKLPEGFIPPTAEQEKEPMEKFEESYAKIKAKDGDGSPVQGSDVKEELPAQADVPF